MAEVAKVWLTYTGEYDERCVSRVFGNEEAAQQMVDAGLADEYEEYDVLGNSPKAVQSWDIVYEYDIDDRTLTKTDEHLSYVAEDCERMVRTHAYQRRYYQEPTPGNPQPAGSGTRHNSKLRVQVIEATSREDAIRRARAYAETWKDLRVV